MVVCGARDAFLGAVLPEAGNMHDDQLGIDFPEHVVPKAFSLIRRAFACLDEDVGVLDEAEEHLASFFAEGVHRYAALVATGLFLDEHSVAHRVAVVGVLKPDDVCAPVGHHGGGRRGGNFDGLVDDLDSAEGSEGWFRLLEFHASFLSSMCACNESSQARSRAFFVVAIGRHGRKNRRLVGDCVLVRLAALPKGNIRCFACSCHRRKGLIIGIVMN